MMAATKSEQFEYNENPATAGFLLSGDTTGVFARCIASVPLSYRRMLVFWCFWKGAGDTGFSSTAQLSSFLFMIHNES